MKSQVELSEEESISLPLVATITVENWILLAEFPEGYAGFYQVTVLPGNDEDRGVIFARDNKDKAICDAPLGQGSSCHLIANPSLWLRSSDYEPITVEFRLLRVFEVSLQFKPPAAATKKKKKSLMV